MNVDEVLADLGRHGDPSAIAGMARYGIRPAKTFGVSALKLHEMAKRIRRDHALALALWDTGVRDARILAALIADAALMTDEMLEHWVNDLDSWDVCDGCCSNLFDKVPGAHKKAIAWSRREPEFVKRAGYALMAVLAVHDKKAPDGAFLRFLPHIKRGSRDERNYVRKAVNWALRQIGKRNRALHTASVRTAREIREIDSKAARWIAADALRELESDAVRHRLNAVR